MKPIVTLLVLLVALCMGGCASTHFVSTWKDPETAFGQLGGEKIAAFLISEDQSSRRSVESALARELTDRGAQGIPGHELLSAEEARDEDLAKRSLEEAGVEAIVTLRIVSEEDRITSTPGTWHQVPTYRYWRGYWVPGWKTVYEPGHTRTDTVLKVETMVYEMSSGKLIWAGLSNTTNPKNLDAFVKELALATDDAMKKSQLVR